MASAVKFQDFVEQLGNGVHNFASHTIKVALTNAAPSASTSAVLADLTQISSGNGYTTGGTAVGSVTWTETGGTATLAGADVVFTATGSVGPLRYAVLYNDTPTSPADPLIAYWDYGQSITMANGDTFTVDFGSSILTIA